MGRHDAGLRLSARSIEVEPLNLFWRGLHTGLLIVARDYERAVEECLQVLEIEPDYVPAHLNLRVGHELLGREEEWLRKFERAYQARTSTLVYLVATPQSDPLRSDPRFDDLLRRINYPGASGCLRQATEPPRRESIASRTT